MDIVIATSIGAVLFLAFVVGLAVSIGSIPFAVITAIVCAMMLFDFVQSSRASIKKDKVVPQPTIDS